jgi:hypothetical protein
MALTPPTRVNYFPNQFIRLADLQDEQAYHLALRRRHNLSHHSWGIVLGLEVLNDPDGRAAIRPGLAVDGYGRELLLLERRVIDRADFDRYGTSRLDLWLEYQLEFFDDRLAPVECGEGDPRRRYRATERAQIVFTRGGALPDPRRPPGVPVDRLQEPLLATPDNPQDRWPVYLGRVTMDLPASGAPQFAIDTVDRVYVGLNAEIIDHPGNVCRIELGHRPESPDERKIGNQTVTYSADSTRDFAVFVPPREDENAAANAPLQPVIAVTDTDTQIRGTATIHGNLVLDGASLQFPETATAPPDTGGQPAIYRAQQDELHIHMGSLNSAMRRLVIGATKDGVFLPAVEIAFGESLGSTDTAVVTVRGNLRIEGTITSSDIRTRTVTDEVAALLTGMVQAGIASN